MGTNAANPRASFRSYTGMFITALACNACCWLPPVLIALGGAGAGFAEFLHPYRPLLLLLMVVQLAWGFRNAYRSHEACGQGCMPRRTRIGLMWVIAVLVVGLNLLPDHSTARPQAVVSSHN